MADSQPLVPIDRDQEGVDGTISGTEPPADYQAASPSALGMTSDGWVALAMILLLALVIWRGAHRAIAGALDGRIATIRRQLDDAQRLRAEAEALKAEYVARATTATTEAEAMLDGARREADAILVRAEADAGALIERRAAMAEAKIAAAERGAVAEVRATAAAAAARAAERLIGERLDAAADRPLVDRTIAGLGRLN